MAHIILIISAVLYYCIVILGLFIFVPMGITVNKLSSTCVLFGNVTYTKSDTHPVGVVGSLTGLCSFIIFLHGIASVLVALGWAILYTLASVDACKGSIQDFLRKFVTRIMTLGLQLIITFLVFACSCTFTIGFFHFCRNVPSEAAKSCKSLQYINWSTVLNVEDGSTFHLNLMIAMGSSWICFVLWAAQTGLSMFVIIRQWYASRKRTVTTTTTTRAPIYKPAATEDPDSFNLLPRTTSSDPSVPPEAPYNT